MEDAHRYGFQTREAYAEARRREVAAALQIAGLHPGDATCLGFVDQECSLHLVELARRIESLLLDNRPALVLTPPYEGGHPDHDSVAFGVHMACRSLARQNCTPPALTEYALYHGQSGKFCTGDFVALP